MMHYCSRVATAGGSMGCTKDKCLVRALAGRRCATAGQVALCLLHVAGMFECSSFRA